LGDKPSYLVTLPAINPTPINNKPRFKFLEHFKKSIQIFGYPLSQYYRGKFHLGTYINSTSLCKRNIVTFFQENCQLGRQKLATIGENWRKLAKIAIVHPYGRKN
jgi:hypothetical protein